MFPHKAYFKVVWKHSLDNINSNAIFYCDMNLKDVKDLEEFRTKNQRLLKLWVGRLLFYSSALYLFTCVFVYYLYFPEQWSARIITALPLLFFPVLWVFHIIHNDDCVSCSIMFWMSFFFFHSVFLLRKFLIFLFSKRTERNSKLSTRYLFFFVYPSRGCFYVLVDLVIIFFIRLSLFQMKS